MPRKTKLTPEIQERLITALRLGMCEEHAAHFVGISSKTLRRWKKRGSSGKSREHRLFYQAIYHARSDLAYRALLAVDNAMVKGDYKAAKWKLEHLFPEHYGKKHA